MSTANIEKRFWKFCQIAENEEAIDKGMTHELERTLLDILNFVKSHPEEKTTFVNCFIDLGINVEKYTNWILLFCMRELRYAEVQIAINENYKKFGGIDGVPRLMSFVSDVNWVYDDAPWEDADFFKYHWIREHPGEPWPLEKKS